MVAQEYEWYFGNLFTPLNCAWADWPTPLQLSRIKLAAKDFPRGLLPHNLQYLMAHFEVI